MLIQQLQLSFDAREDRLLLRIATAEREEIGVALTRRLVKTLWPHLVRMLTGHLAGAADGKEAIEVSSTPTQAAPAAGTGTDAFDGENLSYPLGKAPVLAMESRFQAIDGNTCRIMLGEIRARKVSFECDRDLLRALCAMIRATVDKADWNLDLDALPPPPPPPPSPSDASPTLH